MAAIKAARTETKDKRADARLKALELRAEGMELSEVSQATGFHGAAWHKSGTLEVPENIVLFHIPPDTPEMNPIEQIWKEIRKRGFRNEVFATLEKVVDRLCNTICSLTPNTIFSITGRNWITKAFNLVLV